MKMKYILLSLLLIGFAPSHAQFGKLKKGLKKIKRKRNKAKKTKEKVQSKADGEPEYDPKSQVSRAHSNAKSSLKIIESKLTSDKWKNGKFDHRAMSSLKMSFDDARKNLDKLKANEIEASKPYYKKHEERYGRFYKEYARVSGNQKVASSYKDFFSNWKLRNISALNDRYLFPMTGQYIKAAENAPYVTYKKKKEEYQANSNKDDYADKMIAGIDEFYNQTVPQKKVPQMTKAIDAVIKKSYVKYSFDETWQQSPKECIKRLDGALKSIEALEKLCVTKNAALAQSREKVLKEKKKFEEYISSGRHKAYVKKIAQQVIDRRKLGNLGMRNAALEAKVRQAFAKKGRVLRVVINSTGWSVSKNKYNSIPKYQFLNTHLAVKGADGKCYRFAGDIRKDYLGGGRYGSPYVHRYDNKDEMNCANVNK